MSCERMESRILGYVDGRLKASERLEVEKHIANCAPCRLRVQEFSAVSGLLDELPVIEPSSEFDTRVHALVAVVACIPPRRAGCLAAFGDGCLCRLSLLARAAPDHQ